VSLVAGVVCDATTRGDGKDGSDVTDTGSASSASTTTVATTVKVYGCSTSKPWRV
jgi:NAD-dependent DNA ligase